MPDADAARLASVFSRNFYWSLGGRLRRLWNLSYSSGNRDSRAGDKPDGHFAADSHSSAHASADSFSAHSDTDTFANSNVHTHRRTVAYP